MQHHGVVGMGALSRVGWMGDQAGCRLAVPEGLAAYTALHVLGRVVSGVGENFPVLTSSVGFCECALLYPSEVCLGMGRGGAEARTEGSGVEGT